MHKIVIPALAAALSISLAGQAQAMNTRTWVSGTGIDQNACGAIATPCRTLQYAHDNTAAGGEIDVKDSAGYGSLVVTKAISVVADGVLAGVLAQPQGNAIEVSAAATDIVVLRGLTIEGAGTGSNGILFHSAGDLDVSDCVIQNFAGSVTSGNGILLMPTTGSSQITLTRTITSHNKWIGVFLYAAPGSTATTSLTLDHITATNNQFGIAVNALDKSPTKMDLFNSLVSQNSNNGLQFENAGVSVTVGSSVVSSNLGYGFAVYGATVSSFKNNQVSNNSTGSEIGVIGTATFQ